MDADLEPLYERVMRASRPEEAFKELTVLLPPRLLARHLEPEMEEMRRILTEENFSSAEDRAAAKEARAKLEGLYVRAMEKAGKGLYSLDDYQVLMPLSGGTKIMVGGEQYAVGEKIHVGEHAALYKGRVAVDQGSGGVAMKVAHTPEDNPYLFNEIRMLERLHRQDVGYWRNMPFMLGRFNAGERVGVITRYFEGVTLTQVRASPHHRLDLDQRHVVWVLDRMLGLLGYVHSMGIVHGRIEPDKIRVRPSNHNAMLTGWGRAVYRPAITGERAASTGGTFEAPEIRASGDVGPWTDIYSLGKTLIWLIGGDPVTNEMPSTVEPKLRKFLENMARTNPRARPRDAWKLYEAQNRLKDSLWPRQFIHLNL